MVAVLAFVFASSNYVAADLTFADQDLIVFEDHFLDLSWTDTTQTTAGVDTTAPGYVFYKIPGGTPFALRPPEANEIAAVVQDAVKIFRFNGAGMTEAATLLLPGAWAVAYTSAGDYLGVLASGFLHIYGPAQDGSYREVASIPVTGATAVSPFFENGFLVLTSDRLLCYAWNGSSWSEYAPGEIAGIAQGKVVAFCSQDSSLAVLIGETIRYYRWDGTGFREIASVQVAGAKSVAVEPGGLRVLTSSGTVFYDTSQGQPIGFSALNDSTPGSAIASSPGREHDFAILTDTGIAYRGFGGSSFQTVASLSVAGSFGEGSGTGESGGQVFVSKVITARQLFSRVRLEADQTVPAGASVKYEVSTDGGVTYTEVPLEQNTAVPPGYEIVYRITLQKGNNDVPRVDRVRLLQIGIKVVPGSLLDPNGRSRVRLVQ